MVGGEEFWGNNLMGVLRITLKVGYWNVFSTYLLLNYFQIVFYFLPGEVINLKIFKATWH